MLVAELIGKETATIFTNLIFLPIPGVLVVLSTISIKKFRVGIYQNAPNIGSALTIQLTVVFELSLAEDFLGFCGETFTKFH